MTALRKPDYLAAGYKMAYLASRARHMTGDEFKELFLLINHLGEKGCFPSQETLAGEAGYSQTKVRRLRDRLAANGEIGFVAGTGHTPTRYSIPGLASHTAELKGRRAPWVPESPVEGATQGGTESLTHSLNREDDRPVLKIVPTSGWAALLHRASAQTRTLWLDQVDLVSQRDGDLVLMAPGSLYVQRIGAMLAQGGELHELARSLGIDTDRVTIKGPAHGAARAAPATVPLIAKDQDAFADRLGVQSDTVALPPVFDGNTVSLDAYRTKKAGTVREEEEDDEDEDKR